ncbi:MAG TPA: serine/threonine-protein kinase [Polyangiaceae bacterium]|nr:serine/threonine-protein kinase [Polyangiaceae bacterium]
MRKLGAGGMGVVWVAHALTLGVDVAIKLIRSGLADGDAVSRMAREAQATATLAHPAIVRVFDHGTTEVGDPFLVMELVDGETLGALLTREKKLDVVRALQLILPLLDGLRCAHERGIVHRDIKPENVLLARDTLGRVQPKLLDFGIAKLEHQPSVNRLTQVGDVLGSPEFMSPEQARGAADIDHRTDVWSVSVVLYEMLTGRLPFYTKNYNALMQMILNDEPPPTLEDGTGDRELWRIVEKGLSKARERRWASVGDFGEALAFWLYGHGVAEDACGNSLRAVWLARSLDGQSVRLRHDSWADTSSSGSEQADRAVQTLNIKIRRVRQRLLLLFTPRVRMGVAIALVLVAVLASYALLSGRKEVAAAPPAPSVALPTVTPEPSPEPPVTTPTGISLESLPVEAAPSVKKAAPPRARPVYKKPKRDYGL